MTAIFPPPAWCFVLWCPVARQPQGRQQERCPAVLGPRWGAQGGGFSTRSRRREKRSRYAAMLREASAAGPQRTSAYEHYAAHYVRNGHAS